MGKYKQGVLGGFRGKVGSVVGSYWKGKAVIRALPAKSSKPPTAAQLAVREKFSYTAQFLKLFSGIVTKSFANVAAKNTSSYNAAFTYTLQNVVTPGAQGYRINYFNVRLSEGKLPDTGSTTGSYTTWTALQKRAVIVAWMRPEDGDIRATDYVCVGVYNTVTNQAVYSFKEYTRRQENAGCHIPYEWRRQDLKVWVFTCSADGKQYSRSLLLSNLRAINI